ncbi:acyltransferase [Microbacteriaceae bacterium VKM Ac-2854]|nr:acyltransferase [Microbacteriaceae bacterium VKM Ac-2854]
MPNPAIRLDSLTGIRFFAAAAVFGHHAGLYAADGEFSALADGMVGVSLFYILSGFVLTWTARREDTLGAFYRRRLARIYPVFLLAWIISLGVNQIAQTAQLTDLLVPSLLQSWFPWREVYFAGNAVFWSLAVEAFFYLVFPFLHRLLVDRATRTIVLVMLVAGAITVGVAASTSGLPATDFTRWLTMIFPPLRLMEFVLGMGVGLLLRRGIRVPVPLWSALVLCVVGYLLAQFVPETMARYTITLLPFVLLVWTLAQADLSGRWSPFRSKAIVTGGAISYSFYLIHAMGLTIAFSFIRRAGVDVATIPDVALWGLLLVIFVGCQVVAWLLHTFVETPFEAAFRTGWDGARLRQAYARLFDRQMRAQNAAQIRRRGGSQVRPVVADDGRADDHGADPLGVAQPAADVDEGRVRGGGSGTLGGTLPLESRVD